KLIQYIIKLANNGTKVYYIPGNHDEDVRDMEGYRFDNIQIENQWFHETADGKYYFITHGDQADSVIQLHPRMAKLGSILYDASIVLTIQINRVRTLFKMKHWSFADFLKRKVKDAVKYITHFEDVIIEMAKQHQCVGVICGHIHFPADCM